MTRITLANGTVIEINDGVTIPSWVLDLIADGKASISIGNGYAIVAPPEPAEEPAPNHDTSPTPTILDADDEPQSSHRPGSVYVTEVEYVALMMMREFPEGITSKDVAKLMEVTHSTASSAMWRLAHKRPIEDSKYPLARKISGGRWRCTPLGAKIKVLTAARPDGRNHGLGWT